LIPTRHPDDTYKVGASRPLATALELSEVQEARGRSALKRVKAKRDAVRAEIKAAKSELEVAVNAPVSGGHDPTEWLPDELMLMIMLMLPFGTLWSGACERVCQRWARLMESASIVRRKQDGRWAAYEAGAIEPRRLEGHTGDVRALAIGLDGKVYSGATDNTIMVWSGESGAHLQTLTGHTDAVRALAVGLDGNIYSGSVDRTVRVWSTASGAHVRTLEGHTASVMALAVGLDGKIYSGSADKTIRVWAADEGAHLQTLVGHTAAVRALAVGKDGAIYSGSYDQTIRAWSGVDGTHLRTLVGHTHLVISFAVAPDGRVYSGSWDNTIRV
jgi:WD40 repeat protein